jgi:Rha family phage regulatory protein
MTKLILNTECNLYERNGRALCDSRQVAERFDKRHANVLRDIEELDCSDEFRRLNFELSSYKNEQNKKMPEMLMTKDGFTFLAMGYRGKKAAKFKESYILRFNQMEQFILSLNAAKVEYPALTAAILEAHEEPKHYHFSNEADMINRIALGMSAKQYRIEKGIEKGASIRPYLSMEEIKAIENLQRVDVGLLVAVPEYEERKKILTQYHERISLRRIA